MRQPGKRLIVLIEVQTVGCLGEDDIMWNDEACARRKN